MATGPVMAIGAVDMLIPPSALTVLLGSLSGISITKLLIGGIVPGLILSVAFVFYIVLRVTLQPALAPTSRVRRVPRLAEAAAVRQVRAAAGVDLRRRGGRDDRRLRDAHRVGGARRVCDDLLAMAYRALTLKRLIESLKGTVMISGMILFIIIGATTFAQILSFSGVATAWCRYHRPEPVADRHR